MLVVLLGDMNSLPHLPTSPHLSIDLLISCFSCSLCRYDNPTHYEDDDDEDGDSDSENGTEEMWGEADPNDADEEDEIMHRREEELQAELSLATKRCQELKETLQVTKSFIGHRGGAVESAKPKIAVDVIDGSDDEGLEEVEEYEEDDEGVRLPPSLLSSLTHSSL
jgi:hypothetical protein